MIGKMKKKKMLFSFIALFYLFSFSINSNNSYNESESGIDMYNPTWTTQSSGSDESMPSGGGDIGLNVWTENDDILFYISRSGSFDENDNF